MPRAADAVVEIGGLKATIILRRQVPGSNPQLEVVLGRCKEDEFATWMYRADHNSYFWGRYFWFPDDKGADAELWALRHAIDDFQRRYKENSHEAAYERD